MYERASYMNLRQIKNYRFYFYKVDYKTYVFDTKFLKVYSLNEKLLHLLKNEEYKEIRKNYKMFYLTVLKAFTHEKKSIIIPTCNVTLNFSNICNLNCIYCYRQKKETASLAEHQLEEIMDYVIHKYDKKAKGYSFSLCYTSESSFDINRLKYFDFLIGQNEGYLFDKKQISERLAKKIFFLLPTDIQQKYCNEKKYIEKLNTILIFEKLWNVFDYTNNEYLNKVLKKGKELSYSRTIMANRQILNENFSDFHLKKEIRYISMSFMTNGTNVSDEYVNFIKTILMDTIYVSIDGPKEIHNKNRVFIDGKGSFNEVLGGIKKLQKAGIKIIASVVITPQNIDLERISSYIVSIGIEKISFNLVRGKTINSIFSQNIIDKFIENIRSLLKRFYSEFKSNNISKEFLALRNTMIFAPLKRIYYGKRITTRCTWGNELVIDSKGNLYHCNSTIGNKKDCFGKYTDGLKRKKIQKVPDVRNSLRCKNCYAKYLCGGTCYAEQLIGNKQNENIECYYRKSLVDENLKLYVKLHKESLLDAFMKVLA